MKKVRCKIRCLIQSLWLFAVFFPFISMAQDTQDFLLVVVEQESGKVSFYDSNNGRLAGSVQVEFKPHEIEISQDSKTAFISNFGLEDYDRTIGEPGTSVSVIDIPAMAEKSRFMTYKSEEKNLSGVNISKAPHGVKLRPPLEKELFVNAEVGDSMLVYHPASGQIVRSFPVPPGTHNFIFSPQGDTLWLIAGANGVFRVNPESGEITGHFPTTTPARGLIFTIDQQYLLVSAKNEIYLLHPMQLTLYKHFKDLGVDQIIYSAHTPDGKYILAPCPYDSKVLVIDFETGKVVKRLQAGKAPINVQIDPSGERAFVANALDDHVSVITLKTFAIKPFCKALKPNGMGFAVLSQN